MPGPGEPLRSWLFGLGLTLVLALPVGVFAWVTDLAHEANARSEVQRLLSGMAAALVDDLEHCLAERVGDAWAVAGDDDLATASGAQLAVLAERLIRSYDAYDLIVFAEAGDGRICAAAQRGTDGRIQAAEALRGISLADRPWFAQVLGAEAVTPVLALPMAVDPVLAGLHGTDTMTISQVVALRDRQGRVRRLCVLHTSVERTVHRMIDRTLERLHLMDVPSCTLVLEGPRGTMVDHDGLDPRLRPASAAEVERLASQGGIWMQGSATRDGQTVRIAVDAAEALALRTGLIHRYGLLLVACGLVASAGMAILAMRYRLAKRRVHALLREQHGVAEAKAQAKGEMLAIMSHELRTPLNGLMGVGDLLAETRLDGQQAELVGTLQQAARHLRELIDDALDHERLQAGKMPFAAEPTDWRQLVHQVDRLMQPIAAGAGITLQCSVDVAVPAWLLGDRQRLRQVLSNLLGNALRFTPRGGSVRVGIVLVGGGQRLRCTVSDTGPGIAPERQAAIFEPFVQGDTEVAGRFGGSGLGLSICRLIIGGLGGRIGVDSRLGHGSTFWFEVAATAVAAPAEGSGPTTSLTGAPPLHLSVLVAEDDEICAFTVTHMLSKLGCTSLRVPDGAAAVQAAAAARYDAILLDLHMPVLDGKAAARAIRAAETPGRRTPILALSASDEDDEVLRRSGFDDHIIKPVALRELRAALRQNCGAPRPAAPPPRA